jgi:hypothetical protein
MPTVYRTPTNAGRYRFHKTEDCRQLVKRPRSGRRAQIEAIDLAEIDKAIPCRTCYPDSPALRSVHRYCPECNLDSARPCPHNGGVLFRMTRTHRRATLLSDSGETYVREQYVWPEKMHLFTS